MSKRNKVLLGSGIGVLVVVLIMVSASAKREKGIEVRFETVGRRDLVAAVTASGKIQPKKKVDISADITGRITRIAVREGDLVRRGNSCSRSMPRSTRRICSVPTRRCRRLRPAPCRRGPRAIRRSER